MLTRDPGDKEGVLRGGQDLGVDLVGSGPAYERWQQTPAYQEWRRRLDVATDQ